MIFTRENHLLRARILLSTTLFFIHDVVWEIPEVRKIQQWVFKFLTPFHELHELCLNNRVMVFTSENHLQLARIFFSTTLFFFHDVVWEIPEVRKIQHWVIKFLIPIHVLHGFCLNCGIMVFICENHLQLARIFYFTTLLYFHDVVWEIPEVCKIQQWVIKFLISFHELHEFQLY